MVFLVFEHLGLYVIKVEKTKSKNVSLEAIISISMRKVFVRWLNNTVGCGSKFLKASIINEKLTHNQKLCIFQNCKKQAGKVPSEDYENGSDIGV